MSRHQIVIVDNDPAAALVTQRGLERLFQAGVDVSIATPAAALVRCVGESVDLVIVDPAPSNPGPLSLIKSLREQAPRISILVLTAYDTPGLRRAMRPFDIQRYLAKPVDLPILACAVRESLVQERTVS